MTSTAIRIDGKGVEAVAAFYAGCEESAQRFDANDLTAAVKAARRANPMRKGGSGALGAGAQLRKRKHAVVGTSLTLTALGRFTLGYAHNKNCLKL
jgi:hypothetical protein